MSTFQNKSNTSPEASRSSSSSSSESSSTSGSTSCSGTVSSTSDSETSSSADERGANFTTAKSSESNNTKPQARRKSSTESKQLAATKSYDSDKQTAATVSQKQRHINGNATHRASKSNAHANEADATIHKKTARLANNVSANSTHKKKSGATSSHNSSGGGGAHTQKTHSNASSSKALISANAKLQPLNSSSGSNNKAAHMKSNSNNLSNAQHNTSAEHLAAAATEKTARKSQEAAAASPANNGFSNMNALVAKIARKAREQESGENAQQQSTVKVTNQNDIRAKTPIKTKSSDETDTESGSISGDESSTSSETEASNSSKSFESQTVKGGATRKRTSSNTKILRSDIEKTHTTQATEQAAPRKLTRSFSTRRSKQHRKHAGLEGMSDSDSDAAIMELNSEKRAQSKSPAKKIAVAASTLLGNSNSHSKSKVKKDNSLGLLQASSARNLSPLQHVEKKCPIEGCDSSGHLSGNLDRHFLPEACPIYHNMSASECKERANERKLREEQRERTMQTNANAVAGNALQHEDDGGSTERSNSALNAEQKDFQAFIKNSRAQFRPLAGAMNADKVKIEKYCNDEDREPSLSGLVSDYDLQLFREAQAIASEKIEEDLKDLPVGKGIKYITMGKYKMKVWYQSPYPDDAARLPKMYICEFCLRYQKSETGIKRHALKCVWRHPPGDEIYRKGKLQVWQVDGKRYKQYCQHLCLLAKFFLDHKTLYYDVEPFLFYIMTLADVDGCHTVGYFSKEKNSFYNVSCILTLPPYQRKGYGRLLIDFSYLLTRVEGKIGSPEKPLSDLGLISYRSYWKDVLLDHLCNRSGNTLSIKDVSQEMAIYSYDIVSTLQALGMMKYWKGKHIVLKKQDVLDEYEERVKRRGNFPKIDDTCLRWSPFVPPQANLT